MAKPTSLICPFCSAPELMLLTDAQPSYRCYKCNVKFTVTNPSYLPIQRAPISEDWNSTTPHCPICTSAMKIRKYKKDGKVLSFWGCSQFPKCKGTYNG